MKPEELETKAAAELAKQQAMEVRLVCCSSTGCQSSGAADVVARLKADLVEKGLEGKVQVGGTGCMGLCGKGPLVRMTCKVHEDILFSEMTPDLAARVVGEVVVPIVDGKMVDVPAGPLAAHVVDLHSAFFAMQERVVLSNNGHADPEKLAAMAT